MFFFMGGGSFGGGVGGGGRVAAMFANGSFLMRHLVTSCRSATLKQISGDTRQAHEW